MTGGWVYVVADKPLGTLYVGVTNDIARRAWEHRMGLGTGFAARYRCTHLMHMERHEDIETAIRREKRLKKWPRRWKLDLIEADNPLWEDLFERLNV
jgi:putative endonuclease